jgi:hypothetical protein
LQVLSAGVGGPLRAGREALDGSWEFDPERGC